MLDIYFFNVLTTTFIYTSTHLIEILSFSFLPNFIAFATLIALQLLHYFHNTRQRSPPEYKYITQNILTTYISYFQVRLNWQLWYFN